MGRNWIYEMMDDDSDNNYADKVASIDGYYINGGIYWDVSGLDDSEEDSYDD